MIGLVLTLAMAQAAPDCGALFHKGLQEYNRKDLSQALISFRAAATCNPKLVQAHLAVADIYAERGNDGDALSALAQALAIEPRNELALRAAASLYLKNDLHQKALPLLETLVSVAPDKVDAHTDLAAVYAAGGNRAGAEREFRRSLELQSDSFPALAGLGNLLARAGDDEGALPLLQKAVQLQPRAWEGHFLLGSAMNRLGKYAEAKDELVEAGKLGGAKEPQVYYQLARAWGGLGNAAERRSALSRFSELTKREKDSAERQRQSAALVDEARAFIQSGDLESAVQRLESAREARPGDATLLFRLAGLNFDLKRFDAAREYVQAAVSISPSTWLYHYLLGLVERSSNHLNEAKDSLQTAAKLQPSEAPVQNALGEVLLELNERDAAVVAFERAASLAPGDAEIRRNLEAAKIR